MADEILNEIADMLRKGDTASLKNKFSEIASAFGEGALQTVLAQEIRGGSLAVLAAKSGNVEIGKTLFTRAPSLLTIRDEDGDGPLEIAIMAGNEEFMRMLLDLGVEITSRTHRVAASYNRLEFLSAISYVSIKTEPALDLNNATLAFQYDPTVIHVAAAAGSLSFIRATSHLFNMDSKDENGNTPLMIASYTGMPATVDLLISLGSDIEAVDDGGQTALFNAVFQGNIECAITLMGKGADVNARDNDGDTPVFIAFMKKDREMLALFLDNGAELTVEDNVGKSMIGKMREFGRRSSQLEPILNFVETKLTADEIPPELKRALNQAGEGNPDGLRPLTRQ